MPRVITRLRWAERSINPWPRVRYTGAKAKGVTFEKKVAKGLNFAEHNAWFVFEDMYGLGYCSPDIFWQEDGKIYLVECKLTDNKEAWQQIELLYTPILQFIYQMPIRGIVVAKQLHSGSLWICDTLTNAKQSPFPRPVLHWLGKGKFPL